MKISQAGLEGLLIIEPDCFADERGFFMETWNQKTYAEYGVPPTFVQDNLSFSERGVLRGLHFQNPNAQGKLVAVLFGEVFDVTVDLRPNSATFGKWTGMNLSSDNRKQLYIPKGFAHGFLTLSERALFHYKCTNFYDTKSEFTLIWNDFDLSIPWPLQNPTLSEKDKRGMTLKEIAEIQPTRVGSKFDGT